MSHDVLIARVEVLLAERALADGPLEDMVDAFGETLRTGGLPVSRVMVAWKMIHPLFRAEEVVWEAVGRRTTATRWRYGSLYRTAWLNSPLRVFLESDAVRWRMDLTDPDMKARFAAFSDFAANGHTEYLVFKVGFGGREPRAVKDHEPGQPGIVVSLCTDAAGGFSEADVAALERLRYVLALSCRMSIARGLTDAIARTYLGNIAGERVLAGEIRLGDGQYIPACIWYADMRGSTRLAETLAPAAFIALLNRYFDATAGAVIAAGGEVLDFIGDAVLAIFPEDGGGIEGALRAVDDALARLDVLARDPAFDGREPVAGLAVAMGTVMFGNVGVPERLSFSVVWPTVNRVARVEAMTKVLGEPVLVTGEVAAARPGAFASRGAFLLDGISDPVELFGPAGGTETDRQ